MCICDCSSYKKPVSFKIRLNALHVHSRFLGSDKTGFEPTNAVTKCFITSTEDILRTNHKSLNSDFLTACSKVKVGFAKSSRNREVKKNTAEVSTKEKLFMVNPWLFYEPFKSTGSSRCLAKWDTSHSQQ